VDDGRRVTPRQIQDAVSYINSTPLAASCYQYRSDSTLKSGLGIAFQLQLAMQMTLGTIASLDKNGWMEP